MGKEGTTQAVSSVNNVVMVRPFATKEQLLEIALNSFGLVINQDIPIVENDSYDDRCFTVQGALMKRNSEFDNTYCSNNKFVLKIYSSWQTDNIELLEERFSKLTKYSLESPNDAFQIPQCVPLKYEGSTYLDRTKLPLLKNATFENCNKTTLVEKGLLLDNGENIYATHLVRLTLFIPGNILVYDNYSDDLVYKWGVTAASMPDILKLSNSVEYTTSSTWDTIRSIDKIRDPYIKSIKDEKEQKLLEKIVSDFERDTLPEMEKGLPLEWIHGDLNEHNLLLNEHLHIVGILDFDDCVYSYRVIELANAMMYMSLGCDVEEILRNLKTMFKGYSSLAELNKIELNSLYSSMLMRFVISISVGSYQCILDPDNVYLKFTLNNAWERLKFLANVGNEAFVKEICS